MKHLYCTGNNRFCRWAVATSVGGADTVLAVTAKTVVKTSVLELAIQQGGYTVT